MVNGWYDQTGPMNNGALLVDHRIIIKCFMQVCNRKKLADPRNDPHTHKKVGI